ncbi:hypothetical protein B0H67DRAFT_205943 [Lasiosphaeris hirsuta]|uniref:Uncharacterized protein n=1 Tax=Lasiosphaeris hirsuta TaxID=260670 RepID=A0AA40E350_9PEZI|nr:hypothetical protein B0H67DRAFT_205943 [Lasiosphaeris hirsuta]
MTKLVPLSPDTASLGHRRHIADSPPLSSSGALHAVPRNNPICQTSPALAQTHTCSCGSWGIRCCPAPELAHQSAAPPPKAISQ